MAKTVVTIHLYRLEVSYSYFPLQPFLLLIISSCPRAFPNNLHLSLSSAYHLPHYSLHLFHLTISSLSISLDMSTKQPQSIFSRFPDYVTSKFPLYSLYTSIFLFLYLFDLVHHTHLLYHSHF